MPNTITAPPKPAKAVPITQATLDLICTRVSLGETLSSVCADKAVGLSRRRFYLHLLRDQAARNSYAQAREQQAESWSDEIITISDDSSNDVLVEEKDGRVITRTNHENINRSRLRVDSRKWLMAKLHPTRYSDSIAVNGTTTMEAGDSLLLLMQRIRAGQTAHVLPHATAHVLPPPAAALPPPPAIRLLDPSPPAIGAALEYDTHQAGENTVVGAKDDLPLQKRKVGKAVWKNKK